MSSQPDYNLADRMRSIEPSPFLAVLHAARKVEARGKKVLYLSVGEPDFQTPDNIKAAGIRAIERGDTRYTAMDGTAALKEAIRLKLARDNALTYEDAQITVTCGGTQAIFNTMFATVGPGDEVILPAPFFPPYISAIRLAGATPVLIPTREADGFVPKAQDIAATITPRTRWLVLNSPSNPTGSVIGSDELAAIASVVRNHPRVLVFSDDIYESISYNDQPFQNIVNVAPDFKDRTVILNGVSKAYAMTGWRVGYLAGPAPLIAGVSQVSANSTFTPSSISQAAAIEALLGPQERLREQKVAYQSRRDMVLMRLRDIPDLSSATPEGAFYVFVNCQRFFGHHTPEGKVIANDLDFVLHALNSEGLAMLQGSAFGMPGYFRISYATAKSTLTEAMDRLTLACQLLQ